MLLAQALTVALVVSAGAKPVEAGPKPIEDDYPKALKQAQKEQKLLFVDAWAPWCHSCVFMREHVMNQEAFKAFERDVVFASIDTEKAKNAKFLEKFPVNVWPTLFFIDPQTETVAFTWIGSADAPTMTALLEAARHKDDTLSEADALLAKGEVAEAADKYVEARKKGGDSSARGLLSMLSALALAGKNEPCAEAALGQVPGVQSPTDQVNVLAWGLGCALELEPSAEHDKLRASLVRYGLAAVKEKAAMADDVSGLYEMLVEERRSAKDEDGAVALAKDWLAFLEEVAEAAPTPAARAVFDPHRTNAAIAAKEPERALKPLLLSEKQLAKDYNPPARLALVYRELGKLDDALKAADRSLKKCPSGPRKLRLYATKADLLEKKGDAKGRLKVLKEALAYAKKLPRAQLSEKRLAAVQKQLDDAMPVKK